MFEIANVSTTLLILRSTDLLHNAGRSETRATTLAILVYAGHNLFAAVVAYAGGHWIDRAGPVAVFSTGAGLYLAAYLGFALPLSNWLAILVAFSLAGSAIGLAEAAESTLVAHLLPAELHGSGFGVLGGIQAFGGLLSSAIVGVLWTTVSPSIAFVYAALWMGAALLTMVASEGGLGGRRAA